MYSFLIAIIYLSFISLGLPDSLLGSAWPVIHTQMGVPLSYAGWVSIIISVGTVISGLLSDRLTKKFGAGAVTFFSVLVSAAALFGFSCTTAFWQLCLLAVPYGLSAGAIDAALNNYVALHYSSRHMSWLHCCWGIGTIVSPYIMGWCLGGGLGWSGGYGIVALVQAAIAVCVFASLPFWKKNGSSVGSSDEKPLSFLKILSFPGVPFVLIAFFGYCAAEQTAMLWISSYLVEYHGLSVQNAAFCASLFFIGITAGRFLCGFVTEKIGDKNMIRIGIAVMLAGIVSVAFSFIATPLALVGFVVFGLGCAPVYPSIIHATPENFGRENSQAIIGVQMASAYSGSVLAPPLFGLVARHVSLSLLPAYLAVFTILLLVMSELLNRSVKRNKVECGNVHGS